jgi:hypothetical protein
MTGAIEEVGKAADTFMTALKHEPISLALVVMNVCLLLFFYVMITTIAKHRSREMDLLYTDKKETRELLAKCVVPEWNYRRGGDGYDGQPLPPRQKPYEDGVDPPKPGRGGTHLELEHEPEPPPQTDNPG